MPQMGPMMWMIFPIIMVMMNVMVMIMNMSEEANVSLMDGLVTVIEVSMKW